MGLESFLLYLFESEVVEGCWSISGEVLRRFGRGDFGLHDWHKAFKEWEN